MLHALAVILTNLTRTASLARQASEDRDCVVQALHVLDALETNAVPRRIANFTREYLTLLAKSGNVAPPSPLKDRNQGILPPEDHMSNFNDYLPSHMLHISNFNDHLPSQSPLMQSGNGTEMNGFTMVNSHGLGQPTAFLPSLNVHFHEGRP
jgi:hypothetical protein